MARASVRINVSQAGGGGNCKGDEQEYSQPARRRWIISCFDSGVKALAAQQQRDSNEEHDPHCDAHGKLSEEILKHSEGMAHHEHHRIAACGIEIRPLEVRLAHPALHGCSGIAYAELRKMGLIQEHRESKSSELADSPGCHHTSGRSLREDSQQSIDTECGGEQESRVMKQHGDIQAEGGGGHPAGRIFLESFIQKIQGAGQECQQKRILPHFCRDQDDGRKQGDEEKTDETSEAAGGSA